jgi:RHS repeat-associated protein
MQPTIISAGRARAANGRGWAVRATAFLTIGALLIFGMPPPGDAPIGFDHAAKVVGRALGAAARGAVDGVEVVGDGLVKSVRAMVRASSGGVEAESDDGRATPSLSDMPMAGGSTSVSAASLPANAINPAAVTTIAGNGLNQTVNGVGAGASFRDMGAVAVSGASVYVATTGSIRKVDTTTGVVTTVAGHATETGCVNSSSATAVRFSTFTGLATDGTYLYSASTCGLRRTRISTGATETWSTLATATGVAVAGNNLYVVNNTSSTLFKVTNKGVVSQLATLGGNGYAIAYDSSSSSLWVAYYSQNPYATGLQKITLAGSITSTVTSQYFSGGEGFTALNGVLYASLYEPTLRAYNPVDDSWADVAGTGSSGWQDGTGTEAWFSDITALANDGTRLFVADGGGHRLRRVAAGTPLPATQSPTVGTTVAINPAAVTTAAGNGAKVNVDGSATSGSFTETKGIVITGGYAYVGARTAIRKVQLSTGNITTLAGSPSQAGWVNSSDPTAVRFDGITDLTTDGTYIYSLNGDSLIRRTSIATGATSSVVYGSLGKRLTYGPGDFLYATFGLTVVKLGTHSPTWSEVIPQSNQAVWAVTSDATYLWVGKGQNIERVDPNTGAETVVAAGVGEGKSLASAGNYLYASYGTWARRIDKTTGASIDIAGAGSSAYGLNRPVASGYADGTGTEAWFSSLDALVSDGTAIWAADAGNARIRKFTAGTPLPAAQVASANTTVALDPGIVSTFAGNGTAADTNGVGVAASFSNPRAVTVVGGWAYVGTGYGIRKVDLRTGSVSTLAGSNTESGVVDSSDPSLVRFTTVSDLTSDGVYLYSLSQGWYGVPTIRRTSIATGATSTVYTDYDMTGITYGPGNVLYAVKDQQWSQCCSNSGSAIYRIDPLTGQKSDFIPFAFGPNTYGITSDATHLWVVRSDGGSSPNSLRRLVRIDPTTGADTVVAGPIETPNGTINVVGGGAIVSAGAYVYNAIGNPSFDRTSIRRFSKSDGTYVEVAGSTTSGYADGLASAANFGNVADLATDGIALWVADVNNQRLRRVAQAPVGGGPSVTESPTGSNFCNPCLSNFVNENLSGLTYYPVNVQHGNFFHTFHDLSIPGRGFPIALSRTYNSDPAFSSVDGPFGYGWSSSYSMSLVPGVDQVTIRQENGGHVQFDRSGSNWVPHVPRTIATLTQNGDGTWTFVRKAAETITFDSSGRLTGMRDRNGYLTSIGYPTASTRVITDPAGRTLTLTFTGNHVTAAADSSGRSLTYGYDGAGNLTDVIDVGEGHWTFTYDGAHRMLTMRYPKFYGDTTTSPAPEVTNHYDASGRVDWQSDPLGRTTTFDYVSVPGSTRITDPKGNVVLNTYSGGLLTSVTKGYGTSQASTWRFAYDPVTATPTEVVNPNGGTTVLYVDINGNVTASVDSLGRVTRTTYNSFNQPVSTTDPSGVPTTIQYDGVGNLLSRSTPLLAADGFTVVAVRTTTYNYGGTTPVYAGDVTSIVDPNNKMWAYRYDAFGNLVKTIAPPTPENAVGNTTTFGYDTGRGWLTSSVSPRGNLIGANPADYTTIFEHDAYGRVTVTKDPLWSATTPTAHRAVRHYDANGNLDSTTDGSGNTTTYTYDAADQLLTVTRPDTTTLRNDYWPDGSLHHQYDGADQATTYTYDAQARLASVADPLLRTTRYGYDAAGNVLTEQEPGGNCSATPKTGCTTRSYDAAHQLTGITYSDGTTPNVSGLQYDADGRRTRMTDGTGTSIWTYDSLGRLMSSTNGAGATIGYGYDIAGHLTTLTYPGGSQSVTRGHDAAGRLASVTDWASRTTSFGYDADSNLVTTTYPNGTTATNGFDPTGAMTSTALAGPGGPLASLDYTRDGSGQLASQSGTGVGQPAEAYGYTALQQLRDVNGSAAFGHDDADNLTRLRGATQAFDVANQLTSSTPDGDSATTYGYDNRGNRTSRTAPGQSAVSYAYDQADRLKSFDSGMASYAYNGDGLRESKTVSGMTTAFTWDISSGMPLVIKAGSTSYIHGPGGLPLEQVASDGTTQWFFHDQLGSTRALTDSGGAVVGTWSWDPYGKVIAISGTATTPFGFAGEWTDAESGFVYLRARYYDPATGQFLSRDPLVADTRSPYGYVHGSPLNGIDPTGLKDECGGWVVLRLYSCFEQIMNKTKPGRVGATPKQRKAVDTIAGTSEILAAIGVSLLDPSLLEGFCSRSAAEMSMFSRMERVGSGLADDPFHRATSWVVDNPAAQRFLMTGDDQVQRELYQLPGTMNGKNGIFEWIVSPSERGKAITHQRFIENGRVTGFPNQ